MTRPVTDLAKALAAIAVARPETWLASACGVTPSLSPIPALVHREAYAPTTHRARVFLLSGLAGGPDGVELSLRAVRRFAEAGDGPARTIALSAVPCANPDGLTSGAWPQNGAGGTPALGYPPSGNFFHDAVNPETRYLWRWTCFQAPDLVLELRSGESTAWEANEAATGVVPGQATSPMEPADSLLAALGRGTPDNLGPIPGLRLTAPPDRLEAELQRLWWTLGEGPKLTGSPARQTLDDRRSRSALDVARTLASTYGHSLDPVVYTQGVGISGRLRLESLAPGELSPIPEIVQLVEPYVSGAVDPFPEGSGTDNPAGVVWAEELADATGDPRYTDLTLRAAARYRPRAAGGPLAPCDPDFRAEDFFMNGAVLGRAFRASGDRRYLDMMIPFVLDSATQQEDGLFWHSRLGPYYWGRGNGFAAIGLTETLTYLPEDHPDRAAILSMFTRLMDSLSQHQHLSGMIGQLVDFPGSYQEFTATSMFGYALARGLRLAWLGPDYRRPLDLAWQGVAERVGDEGNTVDGCTGTGLQESIKDYLHRPAVFGFDHRTGSLGLWFATEKARLDAQAWA